MLLILEKKPLQCLRLPWTFPDGRQAQAQAGRYGLEAPEARAYSLSAAPLHLRHRRPITVSTQTTPKLTTQQRSWRWIGCPEAVKHVEGYPWHGRTYLLPLETAETGRWRFWVGLLGFLGPVRPWPSWAHLVVANLLSSIRWQVIQHFSKKNFFFLSFFSLCLAWTLNSQFPPKNYTLTIFKYQILDLQTSVWSRHIFQNDISIIQNNTTYRTLKNSKCDIFHCDFFYYLEEIYFRYLSWEIGYQYRHRFKGICNGRRKF